jgi:DNA uptake protein ComE-like DNA-binding protein
MPTPGERQALGFLVFIALSGASVRLWRANQPLPPTSVAALDRQLGRVDSAQLAPRPSRKSRVAKKDSVAAPTGPVDLDRATAAEIEALPGIGPALAARIVAHRDSAGAFGSMDALCDVRGVGPALAKRLSPLVTFSGGPRPLSATCDEGSKPSRKSRRPRPRELR